MAIKILMPALSPTMIEGTLVQWIKREGDRVVPGDVIFTIETDKAVMEVESVDSGILGKILLSDGSSNVKVGQLIGLLLEQGEDLASVSSHIELKEHSAVEKPICDSFEEQICTAKSESIGEQLCSESRIYASPLAKRIAKERNIDLSLLNGKGTGPHYRIIACDVYAMAMNNTSVETFDSQPLPAYKHVEGIKNESSMRKVIAERLLYSKQNIPHFYIWGDCDVTDLLAVRTQVNTQDSINSNKISINDMVVRALALALRDNPRVNVWWSNDKGGVVEHSAVDIAVAVAVKGGIYTPIVRGADNKSISQLSDEIKSLVFRAKEGSLTSKQFQGGSCTITNLGMYDVEAFLPIINPPQALIIAVGKVMEKPIVKAGQIVARNTVKIALACDHRAVDGAHCAQFLRSLRNYLESPFLMFI